MAQNKAEQLRAILFKLSKEFYTPEQLEMIVDEMEIIYQEEYRHRYSSFFSTLETIHGDDGTPILQHNLESLMGIVEQKIQDVSIQKSIFKFYDHIMLEIMRLVHYGHMESDMRSMQAQIDTDKKVIEQYNQKLEEDKVLIEKYSNQLEGTKSELDAAKETLKETKKDLSKTRKDLQQAKKDLIEANKKAKSIQLETVGVISIFAAIVLAFSGGLSYLSSAISAVHNSPITKLILTVLVCGFILFNCIFILVYVVSRLLDKTLFLGCNDETCEKCQSNGANIGNQDGSSHQKKKKDSKFIWLKKVRSCLPYIYAIDILLLLLIAAVILFMFFQRTPICPEWLK